MPSTATTFLVARTDDNAHSASTDDIAAQSKRDRDNHAWAMLCTSDTPALRPLCATVPPVMRELITKHANSIARQHGAGSATTIKLGYRDKMIAHLPCGWRKKSTNEYVPNAYANKGWSSVYRQSAETVVEIDARALLLVAS